SFPLPLRERVAPNEVRRRVRGLLKLATTKTPHPARRSLTLATSHPLPQGERESAFAARFCNNPRRGEGWGEGETVVADITDRSPLTRTSPSARIDPGSRPGQALSPPGRGESTGRSRGGRRCGVLRKSAALPAPQIRRHRGACRSRMRAPSEAGSSTSYHGSSSAS